MLSKIRRVITTTTKHDKTRIRILEDNNTTRISAYMSYQLAIADTKSITIIPYADFSDKQMAFEAHRARYDWQKAKKILYGNSL